MDLSRELESQAGSTPHRSERGSVLSRLASAALRLLQGRRSGKTKATDPEPAAFEPTEQDPEKGNYSKAENEEACAKIWSIYVGEAERYDKALIESWKADMEGMLIFSGLFSASLTAFLIESYKILQPDSGDLTVAAIMQVSQQLAAIASNTTFAPQSPPPFHPTTASLWCNALWFISLSLSLTCALLATLVEQWAREFLHKTEMRPSPVRRARIFSFLYFGLKRFRMHTIVDVIPFLLHASLLLFFAGLIAFLLPVNHILMYLMGIALCVFLILYAVLTLLPVIHPDCPYRTPLSAPLWSLLQTVFRLFDKTFSSSGDTITDSVVDSALRNTQSRDQRALQWTLDSLTDDFELLPFVEAIPDLIYGPNGFRGVNDHLFDAILGTTEEASPLVARICNLISATHGMAPDDPLRARRCTAGQRAIWALCMMPCAWDRYFNINPALFDGFDPSLSMTVLLAVRYQAQRWSRALVGMLHGLLVNHDLSSIYFRDEVLPTVQRLLRLVLNQEDLFVSPFSQIFRSSEQNPNPCSVPFGELELYHGFGDLQPTALQFEKTRRIVTALHDSHDWAHNCLVFVALFVSEGLDGFPYQGMDPLFEPMRTCSTILSEIESDPPKRTIPTVAPFIRVGFPPTMANLKVEFAWDNPNQLDVLARIAFRLCRFPSSVEVRTYLHDRRNDAAIRYALTDCDLVGLARELSDYLPHTLRVDDFGLDRIVCDITMVASCVHSDLAAIRFIDDVLARRPPDLLPQHSAFKAVRYLRCLRQVRRELETVEYTSEFDSLPHLQEICQDELLHPLSPLFLPQNVHIPTVIESLHTHLLNDYISFLSDFFQNLVPAAARIMIPAFYGYIDSDPRLWTTVDRDVQHRFFAAILTFTKSLKPHSRSDWALIEERLWGCDLFWIHFYWEGPTPSLDGIDPSCLPLMREALKLYNTAAAEARPEEDIQMDTTSSKRLLAEVEEISPRLVPVSDTTTDVENGGHDAGTEGSI